MRARSYDKRMLAASISRTALTHVEPTRADFEASIYDLAFQNPEAPQACVRFSVLALHPSHAERLGPITVRVMENPAPATVRYDFVDNLRPPDAEVFRAMGEERAPCTYRDGFTVGGGGLGQGALAGRARAGAHPSC